MKQCPNCQGYELYDDDVMRCPHCGTELVAYARNGRRANASAAVANQPVRPRDNNHVVAPPQAPAFETLVGNRYQYRGIVTSINPTMRLISHRMKLANTIFRGQPFQIGNPVHETIVRVEEITDTRIPDQMRSLVYYGELGEVGIGDEVTITAVRRHNRLIITRLYDNDLQAQIRPHGIISAGAVRLLVLLAIVMIVLFVAMIVSFFTSGGIWKLINALVGGAMNLASVLLTTLGPLLVLIWIFWLLFRRRR